MPQALDDLSSALALRLRDIARMLDRLDRLESGTGEWLISQREDRLRAEAAEMTLRALRTAADPTNFAILAFLARRAGASIGEIEKASGLGRIALSERINDLVQLGLAGRNIDVDQVHGTAAAAALVDLIDHISQATAHKLAGALPPLPG